MSSSSHKEPSRQNQPVKKLTIMPPSFQLLTRPGNVSPLMMIVTPDGKTEIVGMDMNVTKDAFKGGKTRSKSKTKTRSRLGNRSTSTKKKRGSRSQMTVRRRSSKRRQRGGTDIFTVLNTIYISMVPDNDVHNRAAILSVIAGDAHIINSRDKHGYTPLMYASLIAADEPFLTLLNYNGVDIDAQVRAEDGGTGGDLGSTALILATQKNMYPKVAALLKAGANPNIIDGDGVGALSYAFNFAFRQKGDDDGAAVGRRIFFELVSSGAIPSQSLARNPAFMKKYQEQKDRNNIGLLYHRKINPLPHRSLAPIIKSYLSADPRSGPAPQAK